MLSCQFKAWSKAGFIHAPGMIAFLLALGVLWASGCSHEPLAPTTEQPKQEASPATQDEAPLVHSQDLLLEDKSFVDGLAAVEKLQDEAAVSFSKQGRNVMGTAASVVAGRPVLVALTSKPTSGLPVTFKGADVVQFVVGDIKAQRIYCGTSTSREDECAAGTLGAIVTDGVRNYWLSCWHVFQGGHGYHGDPIGAPGLLDNNCRPTRVVGTVSTSVAPRFDGTANVLDCSIARLDGVGPNDVSGIERAANGTAFTPGSDPVNPRVGDVLKKIGRTTGYTEGTVLFNNATVRVGYDEGIALFKNTVITTAMSRPGDSGSMMFEKVGGAPAALLFAGSDVVTIGCHASSVYGALGVHIPHY